MNNPALEFIRYILGDDYIKFIDIMSGTTMKIPSSKVLERDLEYVRIYLYVKRHGFTEQSIKEVAKMYNKTVLVVRRYVLKVSKVLGTEDTIEGDDLNNYVINIKSIESMDSYTITKVEAKMDEINNKQRELNNTDIEEGNLSNNIDTNIVSTAPIVINNDTSKRKVSKISYEEYCKLNSDNKVVEIIKPSLDLNIHIEARISKTWDYVRIFRPDNSVLADCTLNKLSWSLVLKYVDTATRDNVYGKFMELNINNTQINDSKYIKVYKVSSPELMRTILELSL